jgi:GTP-binding protein HflX
MKEKLKVVIADVVEPSFPKEKMEYRMEELENLVSTYWWIVIVKKIQKRWKPDYKTFLGEGKIQEIKAIVNQSWAKVLILWNILKPSQIYNLDEQLKDIKAKAWDRIDLILKIFDLHAKSPEAKLQIELASIKHMGPRIFGMGMELSRQGGWIWTKWIWETNTEIMKRHLQKRILQIEEKLKQYEKTRTQHRKARRKKWLNTVWIVWYTNAGKSSLLNALTHKWVLAENKLFATLGTSVWELFLNPYDLGLIEWNDCQWSACKKVLLSDTIGFIQDLPPSLIKAFKSTLEDSIESDLLFHVIDISDPHMKEKIQTVNEILNQIQANQERIYIFNKIDKLTQKELKNKKEEIKKLLDENQKYFLVSANKKLWLNKIKKFLYERF